MKTDKEIIREGIVNNAVNREWVMNVEDDKDKSVAYDYVDPETGELRKAYMLLSEVKEMINELFTP